MKYRLLLDEAQLAVIQRLFSIHLARKAKQYNEAHLGTTESDQAYNEMVDAAALLLMAEDADPVQELLHTEGELQGMRDAGLDPLVELGERDPEASHRNCTHGVSLEDDCEHCKHVSFGGDERLTPDTPA